MAEEKAGGSPPAAAAAAAVCGHKACRSLPPAAPTLPRTGWVYEELACGVRGFPHLPCSGPRRKREEGQMEEEEMRWQMCPLVRTGAITHPSAVPHAGWGAGMQVLPAADPASCPHLAKL